MNILETIDLKKYYGSEPNITRALDGVSLTIAAGEFVAIVGTSGSGKSTLLNMIGGLDVPTSGKVIVDGKDLSSMNDEQLTIFRRRKIGFVFQNYNLVPVLNVYENIVLPVELDGDSVDKKFMQDVVRMLALEDILLDPPYKGTEGMYSKANFDSDQHAILFDFMGEINEKYQGEAKFLITYNNDPYIRNLAEQHGFDTFVQTRLHNMRQGKDAGSLYEELLIANYDLEKQAAANQLYLYEQSSQLTLFDFKCDYMEEE